MMDFGKIFFPVGIVAMGLYGLYLGKYEIAMGALGIMGGVIAPHLTSKKEDTIEKANTVNAVG